MEQPISTRSETIYLVVALAGLALSVTTFIVNMKINNKQTKRKK